MSAWPGETSCWWTMDRPSPRSWTRCRRPILVCCVSRPSPLAAAMTSKPNANGGSANVAPFPPAFAQPAVDAGGPVSVSQVVDGVLQTLRVPFDPGPRRRRRSAGRWTGAAVDRTSTTGRGCRAGTCSPATCGERIRRGSRGRRNGLSPFWRRPERHAAHVRHAIQRPLSSGQREPPAMSAPRRSRTS